MRLFTALWPDAAALAATDAALSGVLDPAVWRLVAPERRHITLRFHGEADDADVTHAAARLRAAASGPAAGPLRLRCSGAGRFGDAMWLGVLAASPERLAALVAAAGADPEEHVAHLTVARRRGARGAGNDAGGGARHDAVPPGLREHRGPWWTCAEVTLVAGGTPHHVLDRVALL